VKSAEKAKMGKRFFFRTSNLKRLFFTIRSCPVLKGKERDGMR
jgi:hypothetical protein